MPVSMNGSVIDCPLLKRTARIVPGGGFGAPSPPPPLPPLRICVVDTDEPMSVPMNDAAWR
jgi:hypothetical protein